MSAWFDPTKDGRWPVPHASEWPDDIRETVRMAAQTEQLMQDIRKLFHESEEMKRLSETFALGTKVQMIIGSSRKYTRFEFPHTPELRAGLIRVLTAHGLQATVHDYLCQYGFKLQIAVIRIGAIHETLTYGEP